ncbi:MAG: pilus assembly protein [Hyphomicrobiales bacterium]|nr:MAG: pilus assembly protein [Hyphomicrobiales bacterium]
MRPGWCKITGAMSKKRSWARRLLSPLVRRGTGLARDENGAVAVEFAILAIPFFAIVFAIIETSMTFFAQQVLESALQDTTRLIRTGQSQTGTPWTSEQFRQQVCDRSFGFFQCTPDRLWVKVTPIVAFADARAQMIINPVNPDCTINSPDPETDCNWDVLETYDDGTGSSVIVAQAFYKWPTIVNLPWFSLANQAGNNRLLSAVRVFKNEPFGT